MTATNFPNIRGDLSSINQPVMLSELDSWERFQVTVSGADLTIGKIVQMTRAGAVADLTTVVKSGALSKIAFGVVLGIESDINMKALAAANPTKDVMTKALFFTAGQTIEIGLIKGKNFIAELASAETTIVQPGDELVTDAAGRLLICDDDFVVTTTLNPAGSDTVTSGALVGAQTGTPTWPSKFISLSYVPVVAEVQWLAVRGC